MRDYHINIFYSEEDGGYIADIPDLVACSAFGATAAEALQEVEKAKELWLQAARAEGKPVPSPKYRPVIYQAVSSYCDQVPTPLPLHSKEAGNAGDPLKIKREYTGCPPSQGRKGGIRSEGCLL